MTVPMIFDIGDWDIDYAFARAHRVTNLSGSTAAILGSAFFSSPGSHASAPFPAGLLVSAAEYAPYGNTPTPIHFTGGFPGDEQFSYDNPQGHVGYRFDYIPIAVVGASFGATWSPASSNLSWAYTILHTVGVPVVTTLGGGSAAPGETRMQFPVDLTGFDFANDYVLVYFVIGGTRKYTTPILISRGYRGAPRFDVDFEPPPPQGDGGSPIALSQLTGNFTDNGVRDPQVISGCFMLFKLDPYNTTLRHSHKTYS